MGPCSFSVPLLSVLHLAWRNLQGALLYRATENTDWKLTRLGDVPVIWASQQREPHVILNPETQRIDGSGGCAAWGGTDTL
jgi:hypothetical protein